MIERALIIGGLLALAVVFGPRIIDRAIESWEGDAIERALR